VGNLSSPGCNEFNVMSLLNTIPRTKRNHGHKRIQHPNVKKSSKPRTLQDTFNDLLSNIQKPLGIDVNSIDSFVSKRNMEEFSVVIMKRFRSNWFKKTKGSHVTYNTRQSVLRRKRIYASFVKSKIPKIFEVVYRLTSKEWEICQVLDATNST
jgi:hypothetical protein